MININKNSIVVFDEECTIIVSANTRRLSLSETIPPFPRTGIVCSLSSLLSVIASDGVKKK